MKHIHFTLLSLLTLVFPLAAQQAGDTVTVGTTQFVLTGDNLINNPGFENGFTGWTDATTSAATLSSAYFTVQNTGGVDNSKYLVGTTNAGSNAAGSIGTGWNIAAGKTYYFSYHVKYQDAASSGAEEVWLKVSLTNDKTSNAEPLKLLDATTVNGGGVWTKNAIGFTNNNPSYNYLVARFRWLNNRFGFDNFSLYEAVELPDTTTLGTLIREAEALYTAEAEGAAELLSAIDAAKTTMQSTSAAAVLAEIESLEAAILAFRLLNASMDNPLDVSHLITNPGFESGFDGWTNNGLATQSNNVFTGKVGSTYIEKWVNIGSKVPDVSVQQQLSNLPNGRYILSVNCGNIQQSGSGSTVNNSAKAQTGAYIFANTTTANADTFKTKTLEFVVVDEQALIGFKTEGATGNWVTCDAFSLKYGGFQIDDLKAYLQQEVDKAKLLVNEKMQDLALQSLNTAITEAEAGIENAAITRDDLSTLIAELQSKTINAQASAEAYATLKTALDEANALYADGSGNEAQTLKDKMDETQGIYDAATLNITETNAATSALNDAVFAYHIANPSGNAPGVTTNPNFARGSTMAFGRSTIRGAIISSLKEHGFCWSTHPEPTVTDNTSTQYITNSGYIYKIENLQPSTIYYMRAYAISAGYAVGYGDVIKVITLPKGTVSYTLAGNVTGDMRTRMETAMSEAVGLYNNLTSIKGLWLNVNYGSGTPTAEASYGGYMRFGPNVSYQRTGTALHEMGHTIGVGTHFMWYGPSSPLRETGSRGKWLGNRTTKLMQFIDNNSTSTLNGDAVHMWPYGVNGAHEDNGSEMLYIANALITQALGEDGLPPTGGFATPSYSLQAEEGEKYYIKSEGLATGKSSAYLVQNTYGYLQNKEMTPTEALADDNAAWYVVYNPVNCYYTLQNVATGRYLTYYNTGSNGFRTIVRNSAHTSDHLQLMESRTPAIIAYGSKTIQAKGYWIVRPENKIDPTCLTATTSQITSTGAFSFANSATTQRWFFLKTSQVEQLEDVNASIGAGEEQQAAFVYSEGGYLHVGNLQQQTTVTLYDVSGKRMWQKTGVQNNLSQRVKKGIYLVELSSEYSREVKKVVVE